jgi:hypothetical protein
MFDWMIRIPFKRQPVEKVIETRLGFIDAMYDQKIEEIERNRELSKSLAVAEITTLGRKIQKMIASEERPSTDVVSTRLHSASKPIDSVCLQMIMGGDLWELIYPNDLEFRDVINLGITCKYATQNLLFGWWWDKIIRSDAVWLHFRSQGLTVDQILEEAYATNFLESSRKKDSILLFSKEAPLLDMRAYCMRCVKAAFSCEKCTLDEKNPGPHDVHVRYIGKRDDLYTRCKTIKNEQVNNRTTDYKWPPIYKHSWEVFSPKESGRDFSNPNGILGCTFSYNGNGPITVKPGSAKDLRDSQIFFRYDTFDRKEISIPTDHPLIKKKEEDNEVEKQNAVIAPDSSTLKVNPKTDTSERKQNKRKRSPKGKDLLVIKRRRIIQ